MYPVEICFMNNVKINTFLQFKAENNSAAADLYYWNESGDSSSRKELSE